jgi:hypothetical protein
VGPLQRGRCNLEDVHEGSKHHLGGLAIGIGPSFLCGQTQADYHRAAQARGPKEH